MPSKWFKEPSLLLFANIHGWHCVALLVWPFLCAPMLHCHLLGYIHNHGSQCSLDLGIFLFVWLNSPLFRKSNSQMRRFLPTIYVNPSCIHIVYMFPAGNLYFVRRPSEISQEITILLTPQLPPKQRAAASEPLAVSSQRLHLWRWDEIHWHPLTMVLDIFYQYSTNILPIIPRLFQDISGIFRNFHDIQHNGNIESVISWS
jgi:hypothetical protein